MNISPVWPWPEFGVVAFFVTHLPASFLFTNSRYSESMRKAVELARLAPEESRECQTSIGTEARGF
jgi:hypothetical protein